ncbi:hypothetical protein SAMN04488570_0277 [Nocardioides scoriae]|uniref:Plasmid replication, integration and excision activator n=1 Tax=Nocardioides scoriae TaxID=642780 RepID=A0A1H1LMH5_9ACTN|nr:hypothetical protein [Nocardioides scoriae]SDR75550.1 hypothetical protein SAMN04488570_0277 [Nocardioides scoriae]
MAIPRKLPVEFDIVFPFGAYMVGEISPVRDFDRSTREAPVQAADPDSGMPVWAVDVVDADPEAKKSNRTMTVKVSAKVMPVLDRHEGELPFRPVRFAGMTATAYVEDTGNFSRIAWSLRAKEVTTPSTPASGSAQRSDKAVA